VIKRTFNRRVPTGTTWSVLPRKLSTAETMTCCWNGQRVVLCNAEIGEDYPQQRSRGVVAALVFATVWAALTMFISTLWPGQDRVFLHRRRGVDPAGDEVRGWYRSRQVRFSLESIRFWLKRGITTTPLSDQSQVDVRMLTLSAAITSISHRSARSPGAPHHPARTRDDAYSLMRALTDTQITQK